MFLELTSYIKKCKSEHINSINLMVIGRGSFGQIAIRKKISGELKGRIFARKYLWFDKKVGHIQKQRVQSLMSGQEFD